MYRLTQYGYLIANNLRTAEEGFRIIAREYPRGVTMYAAKRDGYRLERIPHTWLLSGEVTAENTIDPREDFQHHNTQGI